MRDLLHMSPALVRTLDHEELVNAFLHLQEVSENIESESRHDHLTGLRNRRGFEEEVRARIESRIPDHNHRRKAEGSPVDILFIDVDHFKKVNDTHGHGVGDEVLRVISDTVKRAVRPDDIVARWGGEEIVVCLSDMDSRSAALKAEVIRASIAELPFMSEQEKFTVTVSIGVCSTKEVGYALDRLEKAADGALYEAKRGGRNRVVRYTSLKNSKR